VSTSSATWAFAKMHEKKRKNRTAVFRMRENLYYRKKRIELQPYQQI
jgi:hypothetical protein